MRFSMFSSTSLLAVAFATASATPLFAQTDAPPVCINGGPYTFECTGPQTQVQLDGSASFDPDGTPVTFFWFEECPWGFFLDPTSPTPTFVMDMTGFCQRTCVLELRVTSGGQTQKCNTTVTVQDTQAPVITCPSDVIELWTVGPAGGQTDPNLTGFASASDCDPNVVISYTDVLTPGTMPGDPETVVTRTWVALDQCGYSSSCQQLITLLSPGWTNQTFYLDAVQGSCPNSINVNADSGLFTAVIFGRTGYAVSNIDQSSLVLTRADNVGGDVRRMAKLVKDVGRPKIGNPCDCDGLKDSQLDITVTMSLPTVINSLDLASEGSGSSVTLALYFRTNDGKWHTALDCVTIERN
jgi:hypothetical protein